MTGVAMAAFLETPSLGYEARQADVAPDLGIFGVRDQPQRLEQQAIGLVVGLDHDQQIQPLEGIVP
jgi:hypothetical protein